MKNPVPPAVEDARAIVLAGPVQEKRPSLSLSDIRSLGELYATSGMYRDIRSAAQACVKIIAGAELGLGPNASMSGIYIVKERVTLSSNTMAGIIQRSDVPGSPHRFRFRVLEHTDQKCSIAFEKRDIESREWESLGPPSTFTLDDAKKAGLNNPTYRSFPRNMLYARALSNGAKWYCPALFGGSPPYLPDELDTSVQMTEDREYVLPTEPVADPSVEAALLAELRQLLTQNSIGETRVVDRYRVATLEDLSAEQLTEAVNVMRAYRS